MKQKYFLRGLSVGLLCMILLYTVSNAMFNKEEGSKDGPKETNPPVVSVADASEGPQSSGLPEGTAVPEQTTDVQVTPAATAVADAATQAPGTTTEVAGVATQVPGVSVTVKPGSNNDETTATGQNKGKSVVFEVKSGMSSADVAAKLHEQGLVDNAADFNSYLNNRGYANNIKVGEHDVPTNGTYEQVANAICDYKK